jgi:hypothetical protein
VSSQYGRLATRIRDELVTLAGAVDKVHRAWGQAQAQGPHQDLFLDAVALNLHSCYSGLETLFALIAEHVDGDLPTGETWHRDLLRRMATDTAATRPAVISAEAAESLDELRRLRHLVRNVYATTLRPDRLEALVVALPDTWQRTTVELTAFAAFLDDLAGGDTLSP